MTDDAPDPLAPEEAFDVLGDETRLGILRAFDLAADEPVSFSELRDRVGVRDSGQFNYHLDKLVGRFVRKTDDGYELTWTGQRVYGAVMASAYTGSEPFDPVPLDDERDRCPLCDGPLELTHDGDALQIICADCGRWNSTSPLPPSAVEDRDPERLPAVFGHNLRTLVDEAVSGLCPLCSGPTTGRLELWDAPPSAPFDEIPMAVLECERCGGPTTGTAGLVLLTHPAVVSFYHDHGVDVRDVPIWQLDLLQPDATTVVSADPLRVAVAVERDDERLAATVDEDLEVVDVERSSARGN